MNGLVISAENMMREEKKKYYKNLRKGHHEPIIKKDLLEDIEQKNFIVCLVPKIDVQTGEIAGAEAIVRYHHKDLGIMDREDILIFWKRQGCHIISISIYLNRYVRSFISGRQKESRWCRFQ